MTDTRTPLAVRDAAHLIHPVTPPNEMITQGARVVVSGDGWTITDDRGRELIDGFAGLWCSAVGHGRDEIIEAVERQMHELDYFTTFHGQSHPRAIELAERLAGMFPPEYGLNHVMFSSGGSEANETNIKIVRMYWALQGQERRNVVVGRHHGYHGLTIATMTATGIMPMRWNFGPEPAGFAHVPAPYCYKCELGKTYPDCALACADSLAQLVEEAGPETIGAFIAEPVIGAGGIIPPPPDYFARIREICDRYGILLILDEVVTGFGRTGTMFGFEQYGVQPDIVTLAKGLTSGYLPLGASVVSDEVWGTITSKLPAQMPFSHGFTYSGHPVCCAAALANLDIIEREDLPANAAKVGDHLMGRMKELERYDSVGEVRGLGLMIGIELVADKATKRGFRMPHSACSRVEHEAWERGLYARAMGTEVIGLAPPLTIDVATADRMVEILAASIEAMEADLMPAERAVVAREPSTFVSTPREFFEEVLPKRIRRDAAKGLDLVVQFSLGGEHGGVWTLTIHEGDVDIAEPDQEIEGATCTIRMTAADWVRLANGELSGEQAFMTQKLTLEGDLGQAANLMALGIM
ncbi:MAG: aminotransferase class III-fold pyridoxal phosphate-dependent enzyme [Acidimicrobiia bacterium]